MCTFRIMLTKGVKTDPENQNSICHNHEENKERFLTCKLNGGILGRGHAFS